MGDFSKHIQSVIDVGKSLLNLVERCHLENKYLMRFVRAVKLEQKDESPRSAVHKAGGDANSDVMVTGDTIPAVKRKRLEGKEVQFNQLIRKITLENYKLRESNVKLRQESKVQDHRIRDLIHKISLQDKAMSWRKLEKSAVSQLKNVVALKDEEIKTLKEELCIIKDKLADVRKHSARVGQDMHRKTAAKSRERNYVQELMLNIETLLGDLDAVMQDKMIAAKQSLSVREDFGAGLDLILCKLISMKNQKLGRTGIFRIKLSLSSTQVDREYGGSMNSISISEPNICCKNDNKELMLRKNATKSGDILKVHTDKVKGSSENSGLVTAVDKGEGNVFKIRQPSGKIINKKENLGVKPIQTDNPHFVQYINGQHSKNGQSKSKNVTKNSIQTHFRSVIGKQRTNSNILMKETPKQSSNRFADINRSITNVCKLQNTRDVTRTFGDNQSLYAPQEKRLPFLRASSATGLFLSIQNDSHESARSYESSSNSCMKMKSLSDTDLLSSGDIGKIGKKF